MGRFCTGVTVVTTARDDQVHAMTANAFTSVSLQPPLVLVSIDHRTRMHALLPDTRHFGVSVLASDQERVAWHFAGRPMADAGDLFTWDGDVPLVRDAIAHVACTLWDEHEAGDHTLYLGEVRGLHERPGEPLVFHGGTFGRIAAEPGAGGELGLVTQEALPPLHADLAARVAVARIVEVEAIPYALPSPSRPPRFASGAVERADNVLVRIHTDAGLTGHAEAQPRRVHLRRDAGLDRGGDPRLVAPRLLGRRAGAIEAARAACAGLAGTTARAAPSTSRCGTCWSRGRAVLDAVGRVRGPRRRRAHGGASGTPEAMAEDALAARDTYGVRAFKVKVGRDPELDVAAVRAIREALPDADLYADANRGWTLPQAIDAGDALLGLGVGAIEEPIAIDDLRGRALLAARWDVPLAGDESCRSLTDVGRALHEGAVGQVSIKTARTGFSESRDVLALCRAQRLPVVVGSQYEGGLGALASIAFGAAFAEILHHGPSRPRTSTTSPRTCWPRRRGSSTGAWPFRPPPGSGTSSTRTRSPRTGWRAEPVLFLVHMEVDLPPGMPADAEADAIKAREREYAQGLMRDGRWVHIWRCSIAGRYANASVFDVASNDELHELLSGLPLFPYMDITVTALARYLLVIAPEERGAS